MMCTGFLNNSLRLWVGTLGCAAFLLSTVPSYTRSMTLDEVDANAAKTETFGEEEEYVDPSELKDPLEPVNRFIFEVNDRIDGAILRPVAQVYDDITPQPIKDSVTNFMDNLLFPINFVNFVLQGRMEQAGISLFRFMLNTTMGVGGLLDPAAEFGLEKENTGLGDTLGAFGVEPGPYLMLPLFGPSTFRHALGFAADTTLHPLAIWVRNTNAHHNANKHRQWWHWYVGKQILEFVNIRAQYLTTLDDLKDNSLDYYVAVRSVYGQRIQSAQEKIASDRAKIMMDHDEAETMNPSVAPKKDSLDAASAA